MVQQAAKVNYQTILLTFSVLTSVSSQQLVHFTNFLCLLIQNRNLSVESAQRDAVIDRKRHQ